MIDWLGALLMAAGAVFFVAGTVALLRFPDTLTRLHALTKADNVGLGLLALGLALRAEDLTSAGTYLLVWVLVLLAAGPLSVLLGAIAAEMDEEPPP
jgi:multicomponent Na+:H+ antiporter subunit G